jgi:tetratricopeptide (TPR) repeat protein
MFKTWAAWMKVTIGTLGFTSITGLASYATALDKIPKPPDNPSFWTVCLWALGFNDPAATIAAVLAGLGALASLYQLFGPKPYSAKQGLLDRQHQNASFGAADDRHGTRHGETKESLASLHAKIDALNGLVAQTMPQLAESMAEALVELADSSNAGDIAIARQAVDEGPEAAGDAIMATVQDEKMLTAERARQAARLYGPFNPSKAMAAYREATELDPANIWSWIELGRLHLHYTSLTDARACFSAALQRVSNKKERAVLHNEFGDVLIAEGQLQDAMREYEAALAITETLAAREPSNLKLQRNLSVIYGKLGNVALKAGDLVVARAPFEAALAIDETLAAVEPGNAEWQRDLSVSYDNLGNVAVAAGDLVVARARFEAALAIRETLAAVEPRNSEWQRDLSVSYDRLCDVALDAGDLDVARTRFEAAHAIAETLAAREPRNAEWQRDLFISYAKAGRVAEASGEQLAAIEAWKRAEAIMVRLANSWPDHLGFSEDLDNVRIEIARFG